MAHSGPGEWIDDPSADGTRQEGGVAPTHADEVTATPEMTRVKLGPLSWHARRAKVEYFAKALPREGTILDVGCSDNWFKSALRERGFDNVVGLDLKPPADIVGNVHQWAQLGLKAHSIDAIVAFEVLEHDDFSQTFHDLLKPDGILVVTTPLPRMDPICKVFEALRMLQRRTSPHTHLTDLRDFPEFVVVERQVRACISQWGILRPA
jgi:2-polyprenyl-3-methyl-5-hydroxy-6-metoxy-1,4-benzoquinol methylase